MLGGVARRESVKLIRRDMTRERGKRTIELLQHTVDGSRAATAGHADAELVGMRVSSRCLNGHIDRRSDSGCCISHYGIDIRV